MSLAKIDEAELLSALAIIEQFELLHSRYVTLEEKLSGRNKKELEACNGMLAALIEAIDQSNSPIEVLRENPLGGRQWQSIIQRMQISSELIRMRGEPGMSIAKLSEIFAVAPGTISRFFRYYDKAKPSEKIRMQRASIFDSAEQLEELSVTIQRNMARLEGVNDEVNVKLIAELRQTIQLAALLTEKMANYQRYNAFMQAVYDILKEELPQRRNEILARISSAGVINSTQKILKQAMTGESLEPSA